MASFSGDRGTSVRRASRASFLLSFSLFISSVAGAGRPFGASRASQLLRCARGREFGFGSGVSLKGEGHGGNMGSSRTNVMQTSLRPLVKYGMQKRFGEWRGRSTEKGAVSVRATVEEEAREAEAVEQRKLVLDPVREAVRSMICVYVCVSE